MFYNRISWARLTKGGVPSLYVLRPLAGCTPSEIGDEYPVPNPNDKVQMMRARRMYEQRRIGERPEVERVLSYQGRVPRLGEGAGPPPKRGANQGKARAHKR